MDLKSLKIGRAVSIVIKTLPISAVRLGALFVFWIIALVYLAIIGGIAWLAGQALPLAGIIIFLVGIGGVGFLYKLARDYVLYMIKAAHIAVIAEIIHKGSDMPVMISQLSYGKDQVKKRFGEASVMFAVDKIISGIINVFTSAVYRFTSFLPGNAGRNIASIINRVIKFSLNYIDEAILARTFWLDSGSVWANAKDGIILYGMVWKPLLMNAIALMVLSYVPFAVAVILLVAPVGGAIWYLTSSTIGGWVVIALLILAYLIKVAIGDAFAMAAIIASYHDEIQGLEPSPEVSAKLEGISSKFRELKDKASSSLGMDSKEKES